MMLYSSISAANPSGAQVINGQVSIDNSVADVMTINNSPNAIINWQDFDIESKEMTRFIQENSQSVVLNRIIGGRPSEIFGQLLSNGQVLLINPNGVVFEGGAIIDTQGLIASTLNLSDSDFQQGNFHFIAGSNAGDIVNSGFIHAGEDGNILLIAPHIENNAILRTEGGFITLAAGEELTLMSLDSPDIRFQIQAPENSVLNIGKLLTEGGAINVFSGAIKHSEDIQADNVEVDEQGNIQLVPNNSNSIVSESTMPITNQGRLTPILNTLIQGTPEQVSAMEKKIDDKIGFQTNTVLTMPAMQVRSPAVTSNSSTENTSNNSSMPPPVVINTDKATVSSILKEDRKDKNRDVAFVTPRLDNTKTNKHSGQCK